MKDKYIFIIGFGVGIVFTSFVALLAYNLILNNNKINNIDINKNKTTSYRNAYYLKPY